MSGRSPLLQRLAIHVARALEEKLPVLHVIPDQDLISHGVFAEAPFDHLRWVVLSGSFNPLHTGHEQLLAAAGEYLGQVEPWRKHSPAYELSFGNADKPSLSMEAFLSRAQQFIQREAAFFVTFPAAPLFFDKMQLVPDSVWAIGYDTATRLVDLKYYGQDPQRLAAGFARIERLGCMFLVAGRFQSGVFKEASAFRPPAAYSHLFHALPNFRVDLSSTEVRQQQSSKL